MSAQRKGKQKPAQIVRTISKLAGTLTGTTVGIGKKAPVFRAFVKAKTLAAAMESELDAANHELAALESELAVAHRKLAEMREKTKKSQSQLKALQAENESLNSTLKQTQDKAKGIKAKETRASGRAATLETELAAGHRKLDRAREKQSQLSSQLKAFQAENESLNFAMKQARNKTRGAKIKATKMSERVAILETAIATTNGKLAETQEKIKKTQSQLVSQIKALQAKNESLNSAMKQARNKTRGAKIKEGRMSERITTLETKLTTAGHELAERGKKTQSQLSSQLKALHAENESLNSALKQTRNKTRGAKIKGSKMSEHIATLETELATANRKLAELQERGKKTQSQLSSQHKALQAENESLNSTLKQTQDKARGIKAKETRARGHAATLETELAVAHRKLAEMQEKVEKTQSQLSTQLEVLQEKNKSAAVAKKIDAVKVEANTLIQQICDSCLQTQPGTIETTKQQNKKQAELS